MHLYLATTPDHLETCLALTEHLAHVAFRVGSDGVLLTRTLPPTLQGGLLVLQVAEDFPVHAVESLSREVLRLCIRRNFSGVVLDREDAPSPPLRTLAKTLGALCVRYGRKLYVPSCCAGDAPDARVLVCTALSGGTLRQYLEEVCAQYTPQRVALDLQRLMMAFPLPCPGGEGTPLTAQELAQRRQGRSIYYCDGLCARYFTLRHGGETRFILFDDADTLRRKIELAEDLDITEGFFMWPEISDIAAGLFDKKKEGEP